MADEPQQQAGNAVDVGAPIVKPADPAAFFRALVIAAILLLVLDVLLGTLLWLPFFSGLLGFFIEGLIAGGIAFRFARAARPVSRHRLWVGILLLVAISMSGVLYSEYWWFCGRVGRPPMFSKARNVILQKETDEARRLAALSELSTESVQRFKSYLSESSPPGGALGYARWVTKSGVASIDVRGETQKVEAGHRGWIWPVRTAIGAVLLAVGLALAFDALKLTTPVRNVLLPGEEYEEIED
ncbi:MAG: hypothetical protein H6818_09475 [Phycisphaerales bacterium]|nr:hypothetical protein [Phycisphaerales bacterium]MCB9864117.1 hypothetical protein [Phycisphaerales bacterium]